MNLLESFSPYELLESLQYFLMIDAIYFDVHMVTDYSSVYYFLNTDATCTSSSNITNCTMVNGT